MYCFNIIYTVRCIIMCIYKMLQMTPLQWRHCSRKYNLLQVTDTNLWLRTAQFNTGLCFVKLLRDRSVLLYSLFMFDVTDALNKIWLVFQEKKSTLADPSNNHGLSRSTSEAENTVSNWHVLKICNQMHTICHRIFSIYSMIISVIIIITIYDNFIDLTWLQSDGPKLKLMSDKDDYMGCEITGNRTAFDAIREKVLNALMRAIEVKFSDMNDPLVRATLIINLDSWPPAGSSEIDGVNVVNCENDAISVAVSFLNIYSFRLEISLFCWLQRCSPIFYFQIFWV